MARLHHMLRTVGPRPISLVITSDQTSYNFFTSAGSPGSAVTATVQVASGIKVRAFTFGNFPAGSVLTLVNYGYLYGIGGTAGTGGDATTQSSGTNGSAGQDAVTLVSINVTIDNTYGYIYGGGGGGGGGGGLYIPTVFSGGGGGGGGGQGLGGGGGFGGPGLNGAGANGTDGSFNAAGLGGWAYGNHGFGGDGGGWGGNGHAGVTMDGNLGFGNGGAAGKAVNLNGNTVTWLGGNNSTQVKGTVS